MIGKIISSLIADIKNAELERKNNTSDEKKKDSQNEAHNSFKDKDKESG